MVISIKRKGDKKPPKKTMEELVTELREEIAIKDLEIEDLKTQVEIVQVAVDDLIFGGML